MVFLTPRAGFEPATNRLTVDRSTAELPRIERVNLALTPSALQVALNVAFANHPKAKVQLDLFPSELPHHNI